MNPHLWSRLSDCRPARTSGPRAAAVAVLVALAVGLAASPAVAASSTWVTTGTGAWATGTNWNAGAPGSISTTNSTDIATFSATLAATGTVTVDANRNVSGITFANSSAFGYTLQTGALRLSNGGVIQTASGNGNHTDTISSAIAIQGVGGSGTFTAAANSGTLSINAVSGVSTAGNTTTLTLNGGGTGLISTGANIISNGTFGGTLAVVKSGTGVWRMAANVINTFSGGLTLSDGRLTFLRTGAGSSLGTGTVTFNGGGLSSNTTAATSATNAILFTGNGTLGHAKDNGTLTLSGPVDLGGATRTLTVASSGTLSGVISNGGLTKTGTGPLTLSGNNTYTGPTTVSTGTLTIGDGTTAGSIASSSGITIDSGARLNFGRTDDYGGAYASPISGAGALDLASGALSLTGNNASFSGPVTIGTGTLSIGSSTSLGTGTVSFTANNAGFRAASDVTLTNSFRATTNAGGGNFFFAGTNNISAGQLVFAATGTGGLFNTLPTDKVLTFSSLTNNGASQTARIRGSGNTTFTDGVLNNGAGVTILEVASTGTTTIGGTSTFTGDVTQAAGGRLVINSRLLGSTGTYAGSVTANGIVEYTSSGTTFSSGGLVGAGQFVVNGPGSWVTSANSSFTGTVSILAGKYLYNNHVGAGTGTLVFGGGSIVNSTTSTVWTLRNPTLIFTGSATFGDVTNTAPISFLDTVTSGSFINWTADLGGSTRTLTVLSTTATIPHMVGNGGITKEGPGVLVLSNTNTFSGTTRIDGGTLSLNGNSRGLQNSMVDLGGSGTLTNYSTTPVFGGITNYSGFSLTGSTTRLTINVLAGGTQTYSTLPGGGAAGIGLGKTGPGTLVFAGSSTWSGATTIDEGVFEVASVADRGIASPLGSGTTITLGSGTTAGTLRYVGGGHASNRIVSLSGSGGVIDASGAGALDLSAGSISTSIANNTLTLLGTSTSANAVGVISGTTLAVVKDGPGTWRLTSASSDYSGSFTVKDGTVVAEVSAPSNASGAFGRNDKTVVVGDAANGTTGTVALLNSAGSNIDIAISVVGTNPLQTVLIGGANASGTATYGGTHTLTLGRSVSIVAATGGVVNFARDWTASGTAPVDVAIGAPGYAGTVRLTKPGTLATTGAVSIRYGTALLTTKDTIVDGTGTLAIDSGATLGGIGTVAAPLGGAGLVAPGNSAGILTAEAFDPTGGLDLAFEFENLTPTYSNSGTSVNDVLRLTGASPFASGTLSAANVVNVYLPSSAAPGDVFLGGFYTNNAADFSSSIQNATWNYWIAGSGTHVYGSGTYAPLDPTWLVSVATTPQSSGTFANGDAVNGQVSTFTIAVPEPAAVALAGIGVAIVAWAARRRRFR